MPPMSGPSAGFPAAIFLSPAKFTRTDDHPGSVCRANNSFDAVLFQPEQLERNNPKSRPGPAIMAFNGDVDVNGNTTLGPGIYIINNGGLNIGRAI